MIAAACREVGIEPVRADGLSRAGEITEQVFRRLRDDDVVIADLTGANANVMYELGLRHTRGKITLQVGEFSRLPFDVNVIRTVMFSRSPHGLITARNELQQLLRSALAGQYDSVTATRIWTEEAAPSAPGQQEASDASETDEDSGDEGSLGFVDIMANAEENQERLNDAATRIASHVEAMGRVTEEATEKMARSDAQGRGMKGRLAVTVEYANGLTRIAEELDRDVDDFADAMSAVSAGNLALIERLEEDPTQLQDPQARDFGLVLRQAAQTARETASSLSEFVSLIMENAKMARALREPSRRISDALNRFTQASALVDEWDRRLQGLGVPLPPPGWELPSEDENGETKQTDEDPPAGPPGISDLIR